MSTSLKMSAIQFTCILIGAVIVCMHGNSAFTEGYDMCS